MSRKPSPAIALVLIAVLSTPTHLMAGPLGLFRCCRTKPVCCSAELDGKGTAVRYSAAEATSGQPVNVVTCYVRAVAVGTNSMGYTCTSYSDWHASEDCEQAKAAAIQEANSGVPADCSITRVETDCVPVEYCTCCDSSMTAMMSVPAKQCQYRATFTIRCCDGQCIERTITDPIRSIALKRARDAACLRAKLECGGKIRCCCWKVCRVRN